MYNKRKFNKINDKKVLHKVKKQWVTVSLALFMMIGGGAVASHTSASADRINNNKNNTNAIHIKNNQLNQSDASTNISAQANEMHQRLLFSANNEANLGSLSKARKLKKASRVTVNNKPTYKISNINQLKVNHSGVYHNFVFNRINLPFYNVRVNRAVKLFNSVDFGNNRGSHKSLYRGQIVKVRRAFREYGHYNDYLRYEIRFAHNRSGFITGNPDYVSYVLPSRNYKRYQHETAKLLRNAHNKNFTRISKKLGNLIKHYNRNYRNYAKLYAMAFNLNQSRQHPVTVEYHTKRGRINKSLDIAFKHSRAIVTTTKRSNDNVVNSLETSANNNQVVPESNSVQSASDISIPVASDNVAPVESSSSFAPSSINSSQSSAYIPASSTNVAPSSTSKSASSFAPASSASTSAKSSSTANASSVSVKSKSSSTSNSIIPSSNESSESSSVQSNSDSDEFPNNNNHIKTGTYYGLNYKYNPDSDIESLEFTNGTLTWNGTDNQNNTFLKHLPFVNNIQTVTFDSDVNTSKLTNASYMFYNFKAYLTLPNYFGQNVVDANSMFRNNRVNGEIKNRLSDGVANKLLVPRGFGSHLTNASNMFRSDEITHDEIDDNLVLPAGFGQDITDASGMFRSDSTNPASDGMYDNSADLVLPSGFGQNIVNASDMFRNYRISDIANDRNVNLPDGFGQHLINVNNMFNVSRMNVTIDGATLTNANHKMFTNAGSRMILTIKRADTSHLTDASDMFRNVDVESIPQGFGQNITNANGMFASDSNITLPKNFGLNITSANDMFKDYTDELVVNNVIFTNANHKMFSNIGHKATLYIKHANTSHLTNASDMFKNDTLMYEPSDDSVGNKLLPKGFGANIINASDMFKSDEVCDSDGNNYSSDIILPKGFGQNITNAKGMFQDERSTFNGNTLDLPKNFGANIINASDMFRGNHYSVTRTGTGNAGIIPKHFGQHITNASNMFRDNHVSLSDSNDNSDIRDGEHTFYHLVTLNHGANTSNMFESDVFYNSDGKKINIIPESHKTHSSTSNNAHVDSDTNKSNTNNGTKEIKVNNKLFDEIKSKSINDSDSLTEEDLDDTFVLSRLAHVITDPMSFILGLSDTKVYRKPIYYGSVGKLDDDPGKLFYGDSDAQWLKKQITNHKLNDNHGVKYNFEYHSIDAKKDGQYYTMYVFPSDAIRNAFSTLFTFIDNDSIDPLNNLFKGHKIKKVGMEKAIELTSKELEHRDGDLASSTAKSLFESTLKEVVVTPIQRPYYIVITKSSAPQSNTFDP